MPKKITTLEMEIALANHFGFRKNLIVPNVKWGLNLNGKPMLGAMRIWNLKQKLKDRA